MTSSVTMKREKVHFRGLLSPALVPHLELAWVRALKSMLHAMLYLLDTQLGLHDQHRESFHPASGPDGCHPPIHFQNEAWALPGQR
jgi:hypothetical protein